LADNAQSFADKGVHENSNEVWIEGVAKQFGCRSCWIGLQKLKYIHDNPVVSGFVRNPIDWKFSSARNYGNDDHTILEIDIN
jgi:hypothetical protein